MALHPTLNLSIRDAPYMLRGLLAVDEAQMRRAGPNRPRIHDLIRSGYLGYSKRDPYEHWQTYDEMIGQLRRKGYAIADCEDLATAAAAEMRLDRGHRYYDPGAVPHVYKTAPRVSHVVVHSPRWGLLDPSVAGGMGQPYGRYAGPPAFPYPPPPSKGARRRINLFRSRAFRRRGPF